MIWLDRIVVMLYVKSVMTWNKMASITSNYIAFLIKDAIGTWLCGFLYDFTFLFPIVVSVDAHSNN